MLPILALQRAAGNAAVGRLRGGGGGAAGRRLAREAGLPCTATGVSYTDYLDTLPVYKERFAPSTGAGLFDVIFSPGVLMLNVKVRFKPWPGNGLEAADAKRFAQEWWGHVSTFWKPGLFTFYCQCPGWEDLKATVWPVFELVEDNEHFTCWIDPPKKSDDPYRAHVDPPHELVWTDRKGQSHAGLQGRAYFSRDANESRERPHGSFQRTSVHEAGHMLGLTDEYVEQTKKTNHPAGMEVGHSALAQRQLGTKVVYADTDAIMSQGETILPRHSVTMREALEQVSGITQWALTPRPRAAAAQPATTGTGAASRATIPA